MYLIRAVTVHSNRPKEVWFGPSTYTARILWSGGKFFLIEGPQRPPPGLSGLHVVPPVPSAAADSCPSLSPSLPQCAGARAHSGKASRVCERAYGLSKHQAQIPHRLCMSHGQQTFVLIVHDSELTYLSHFFTV